MSHTRSPRLTRRLAALGTALTIAVTASALAATSARAAINVKVTTAKGQIAPAVMGSTYLFPFAGMGSFDTATNQFYPSFLQDLNNDVYTGSLRFPGGIAADFYHWEDAIGAQSSRTDNAYGPSTAGVASTVGPDAFGRLLDKTGASGVMTVNFSTGTAAEAAAEVQYMTGANGSSTWANLRASNGHSKPYDVTTWEVGNEEYSSANSWRNGTPVTVGGPSSCVDTTTCEYIYGGTTSFTKQATVGAADRESSASYSTGAANQSFYVKYPQVTSGSQTVYVGGKAWSEVSSLTTAGSTDDVYTIDDTTGKITFGNGVHGAIPADGKQVTVSYESGPHDGFNDFYTAMKEANPKISVCATDTSNYFIEDMGSTYAYDCFQVHPYVSVTDSSGNIGSFEKTVMSQPYVQTRSLNGWEATLEEYTGHAVPLDLSEYGSLIADSPDPALYPNYYQSVDEALLNATQLASWIKLKISVADRQLLTAEQPTASSVTESLPAAAPYAPTAAITTPGPDTVVQPTGLYLRLFEPLASGTLIQSTATKNPVLTTANGVTVHDLMVVSAKKGKTGDVVVINQSPTRAVTAKITVGKVKRTVATVARIKGATALSYNTTANPNAVKIYKFRKKFLKGKAKMQFPAHSITRIGLRVK